MPYITIDPFYDIQFYNETLEALKNNDVEFKELLSTKAPYQFYLEVPDVPMFINYEKANSGFTRYLINIIDPLKPDQAYIYRRRDSFSGIKGIKHYGINDALKTGQESGEGIFFHMERDEAYRISKEYPRKIWFMGRYFKRKYKLFFTDKLLIKNFINPDQVLIEGSKFKIITDLEVELNYKIFREKDRLEKLSETTYLLDGKYNTFSSVRPDLTDKFILR